MPKASPVGIATFDQSRNGPDDRQQASTTIPDESLSRIFKVSSPLTRPDGAQAVFGPIRHVCTMAARLFRRRSPALESSLGRTSLISRRRRRVLKVNQDYLQTYGDPCSCIMGRTRT